MASTPLSFRPEEVELWSDLKKRFAADAQSCPETHEALKAALLTPNMRPAQINPCTRPPGLPPGAWMRSSVDFGGYPEYQQRRAGYSAGEPDEEPGAVEQQRTELEKEIAQLRLLHHVVVSLHKGDQQPEVCTRSEAAADATCVEDGLRRPLLKLGCEELRGVLRDVGDWRALKQPVLFEAPPEMAPDFATRRELISKIGVDPDFQTATVLCDALAAQFGPSMLGEDRHFSDNFDGNCFTQLNGNALEEGTVPRRCWDCIPDWMRCSMVVLSTGPGGSGVAFHKHATAWLVLLQGAKRWYLYPPGGPPTAEAYEALALCTSWRLAEAVRSLPAEARPLEVLQRAGEGLLVPALWWHATCDEGPTLGIGSQFNMADLDILQCHAEYSDSAFVLYHVACEVHKTDEERAKELFEEAIAREPLNFYYGVNQLLFCLNLVFHPKMALWIIERLQGKILDKLDTRRQMIVQRFLIPTVCNFAEWHVPHDKLVKYSRKAIRCAWDAMLALGGPFLPGGERCSITRELPALSDLRYTAQCFQCGGRRLGRAGPQGSTRAHRFFCDACEDTRARTRCEHCGEQGGEGMMGHSGTAFCSQWFCSRCWLGWNAATRQGLSDNAARLALEKELPPRRTQACRDSSLSAPSVQSEPLTWEVVD